MPRCPVVKPVSTGPVAKPRKSSVDSEARAGCSNTPAVAARSTAAYSAGRVTRSVADRKHSVAEHRSGTTCAIWISLRRSIVSATAPAGRLSASDGRKRISPRTPSCAVSCVSPYTCQPTAELSEVTAVPEKKRLTANQRNGASRSAAKRESSAPFARPSAVMRCRTR
jgi:hypothetical protein